MSQEVNIISEKMSVNKAWGSEGAGAGGALSPSVGVLGGRDPKEHFLALKSI